MPTLSGCSGTREFLIGRQLAPFPVNAAFAHAPGVQRSRKSSASKFVLDVLLLWRKQTKGCKRETRRGLCASERRRRNFGGKNIKERPADTVSPGCL